MRTRVVLVGLVLAVWSPPAYSEQGPLTLADAMQRARTLTPESQALTAAEAEAAQRIRSARAGYLPRVDFSESVQRGNQPVFVFSSLLSQRRFAAANFAIPSLNEPDPITNVRTTIGVEQSIYDSGATRFGVRVAELGRDIATLTTTASAQDLAFGAAQAFVRVLEREALHKAAAAAVQAAASDVERARARRETGVATSADLLAAEVHLTDMRQREITAVSDLSIARLQLNLATGATGDSVSVARPNIQPLDESADALVREALTRRPDLRTASLVILRAQESTGAARAAFLPRVDAQGGVEFNGVNLTDQESSWFVGAQLQVNVFRGFSDDARLAGAKQAEIRARAEREALVRRVEVEVRAARARLDAARGRDEVGRAALAQAREAQRIIRDRYESGLATITELLRAAESVFDAEARATAAEMDVILQTVALDRAVGRL